MVWKSAAVLDTMVGEYKLPHSLLGGDEYTKKILTLSIYWFLGDYYNSADQWLYDGIHSLNGMFAGSEKSGGGILRFWFCSWIDSI